MNETHDAIQSLPESAQSAARVRAAADGEIETPAGCEAEAAFERELQKSCGRVMSDTPVPAGLADRVKAAIAADDAATAAVQARATETSNRSFWANGGRTIVALAAGVALAFAGIWGLNLGKSPSGMTQEEFASHLAAFVAGEHTRTLPTGVAEGKFEITDINEAPRVFQARLGSAISVAEGFTNERLTFRGASNCAVPGKGGESAHFQFLLNGSASAEPGEDSPSEILVSLFVKPNDGALAAADGSELVPGRTYELDSEQSEKARVIAWTDGDLVYIMVSKACDRGGCDTMLRTLELPDPEDTI